MNAQPRPLQREEVSAFISTLLLQLKISVNEARTKGVKVPNAYSEGVEITLNIEGHIARFRVPLDLSK